MGDPYYRYPAGAAAADRGSIPMPSFPSYFSSEAPSLLSHRADMHVASSDIQNRDISQMQPGMYGANDISNSGVYPESNLGGLSAGASVRAYPSSLGDPSLGGQRWHAPVGISSSAGVYPQPSLGGVSARPPMMEVPNLSGHRWDASSSGCHPEPSIGDVSAEANIKGYPSPQKHSTLVDQRTDGSLGTNSGIPNAFHEKTAPVRNGDVHTDAAGESNILFVDGLPTDCSRREVGHLFRPFAGFKDIKVIHKEPRRCPLNFVGDIWLNITRSGDRAMVLCFVEFDDSKCAMTAMGSLQGYIFDDKKPDSPALRIQFAHFPFHFPADRNDELRANRRNDQRL